MQIARYPCCAMPPGHCRISAEENPRLLLSRCVWGDHLAILILVQLHVGVGDQFPLQMCEECFFILGLTSDSDLHRVLNYIVRTLCLAHPAHKRMLTVAWGWFDAKIRSSQIVNVYLDPSSVLCVQVSPALQTLARLLSTNDEDVLTDACWALSYLSDGTNDKIQAVIDAGVCRRLVELLMWVYTATMHIIFSSYTTRLSKHKMLKLNTVSNCLHHEQFVLKTPTLLS